MGYRFCSAESAIATCDSYNWPDKSSIRRRKKHRRHQIQSHHNPDPAKLRRFAYADLEAATGGFSPLTLLGKGSHGAVYRAVLDSGSLVVAVKRPKTAAILAAKNEIKILPSIRNDKIVNLVGYAVCVADPAKLLLVVEYMPNGSLYDLIHKHPKPPSWSNRVRIALHVAKAVRTLHGSNPPVMHRDIKSSNVLIDEKGDAKLSDFGLALRGHVEDVRIMSTPPAGTLGYLDPCYLAPGDVSTKCDVFSFGILLLEIISGRRAIDVNYSPPSIVDWALPLIKSGNYQAICDRRIGCIVDPRVIRELAVMAARCVRSTVEKRPCVTEVVECLKRVYKRVQLMQAVPIWNNIRRRVRCVERSQPSDDSDGSDWEEHVKTPRHGSRKILSSRTRKVSNVPASEDRINKIEKEVTRGSHRTRRSKSKSIGSFWEIKVGPEVDNCEIINNNNNNNNNGVKKRGQVTVKVASVRLSKSRSLSVIQSSKNSVDNGNLVRNPQVKEVEVFPLLVNSSSKSDQTPK